MKRIIHGEEVKGVDMDDQTRCGHWHGDLDIIAIKLKCCGAWFACFECHASEAAHAAAVWLEDESEAKAVLCGGCGYQLTIQEYFGCDSRCPKCKSKFNPGCAKHYHLYFEIPNSQVF